MATVLRAREDAVGALYREHRVALLRLAVLLTDGDVAEAEDLVQDAFTALYRRWDSLPDNSGALGYLKVSIVNRSRSLHRRRLVGRKHLAQLVTADAAPADVPVLLAEEHREVLALVSKLPRRQRSAVVLRYWAGMSVAEVADVLHVSPGTVKSSVSRALATLAVNLEVKP